MKLFCSRHRIELRQLFCQRCYDTRLAQLNKQLFDAGMTQVTTSISGVPKTVYTDTGLRRLPVQHHSEYLEFYVPASLYKELSTYIEARLAVFHKTCTCAVCISNREQKNAHDLPLHN